MINTPLSTKQIQYELNQTIEKGDLSSTRYFLREHMKSIRAGIYQSLEILGAILKKAPESDRTEGIEGLEHAMKCVAFYSAYGETDLELYETIEDL